MSLICMAWLQVIVRWLAEWWSARNHRNKCVLGGRERELTWSTLYVQEWSTCETPNGIFLWTVDYNSIKVWILEKMWVFHHIMDILSHWIGCIHQEVCRSEVRRTWRSRAESNPSCIAPQSGHGENTGSGREGVLLSKRKWFTQFLCFDMVMNRVSSYPERISPAFQTAKLMPG